MGSISEFSAWDRRRGKAADKMFQHAVVIAATRKVTFLDALIQMFDRVRSGAGGPWHAGRPGAFFAQQAADGLLGLACLWICLEIFRSSQRRQPFRAVPSRWRVWPLGIVLISCGLSQLSNALTVLPASRLTAVSLLASLSCWAGAVTLAQSRGGAPVRGDVEGYEHEIAERQRAEAALRSSEAATRKLAEADARKNEFLAMLGHELRNPLAPIRNAVKVMKQRGAGDPDLSWARDVVDHQVRQMAQLVDDLLEMSRVTSGKVRLQKEPVDVATIVAYAIETSRPVLEAHHHRLSIALPAEPVHVDADSIRMAQVLSNLLNNAAKYTKRGGQVRLTAAVEGAEVVFRVRDNGIGIPSEMLSRIFDLFAQVDHSLDHSQGGLGLGLTLVRSLVEMHGGSVQAHSDGLSRGSEFVVRLPVLKLAPPEPQTAITAPGLAPAREEPVRGPAYRVLVVDDNVLSAQSMAMVLKLEGHDVEVSHDGGLALEAVRRFRPEIVLMDIGLPGMDGYEVARRLRADAQLGAGIALLAAVTGYAEDDARRRSREAGFDHHLVKPVDPDGVLALLASLEWREGTRVSEPFASNCPQLADTVPDATDTASDPERLSQPRFT
jgi:signal transduction histidine kinase/DNA-binding NarL/FixJ family response regulator